MDCRKSLNPAKTEAGRAFVGKLTDFGETLSLAQAPRKMLKFALSLSERSYRQSIKFPLR